MRETEEETGSLAVGTRAVVDVPATSANLGPGFDCFGLALEWHDRVGLEVIEDGFVAEVTGEGADQVLTDERHLIVSSARAGLADLGVEVPGLRVRSHNTIPHGRGLGSSSAAIVAGLAGALALAGRALDPDWLLRHANRIEGHPDNVAAAIHGGFVLAYADERDPEGTVRVAGVPVLPEISAVVWVPAAPVATEVARGLLPATVPHADAAANAGRAALLVHAMSADPSLLPAATRDWLHQSYRAPAMPDSAELVRRLRADGHAALISGAGPTVLALTRGDEVAGLIARDTPGFAVRGLRTGGGVRVVARAEREL
ncbi:homoserine kinase [Microlunatus ginsengisoli]|uniref:Homoserine kinase n=1 Tax=Microlunatus ginsengisoli TaxID=363863 RepID=A0ABP6ZWF7_9ACTN